MVTSMAKGAKHPIALEMRWNFGDSRSTALSLDEFLAQKEADGVEFFAGKEPWLKGLSKLNWQTFFRVCTEWHEVKAHLGFIFRPVSVWCGMHFFARFGK